MHICSSRPAATSRLRPFLRSEARAHPVGAEVGEPLAQEVKDGVRMCTQGIGPLNKCERAGGDGGRMSLQQRVVQLGLLHKLYVGHYFAQPRL